MINMNPRKYNHYQKLLQEQNKICPVKTVLIEDYPVNTPVQSESDLIYLFDKFRTDYDNFKKEHFYVREEQYNIWKEEWYNENLRK